MRGTSVFLALAAAAAATSIPPFDASVIPSSRIRGRQATIPKPTANQCSQNQYLGAQLCGDQNETWTNQTLPTLEGWFCCFQIDQEPVLT